MDFNNKIVDDTISESVLRLTITNKVEINPQSSALKEALLHTELVHE